MKKPFRMLLLLLLLGAGEALYASTPQNAGKALPRPKLVVGIVIDQMRWDYLYRYYDRYGEGGFRRFLSEGVSCENTMITHLPAYTGVGHATIYTGTTPAVHGIAANDFTIQKTGEAVYCVDDGTVEPIGSTSAAGRMSPRNLLASTVTDELRIGTQFRSKVISVSLKDRAAILPAGHAANGAYWFDSSTGRFISSSWYVEKLPGWLEDFNKQDRPRALMQGKWETLYAPETYTASTPDDTPYETPFFRGERPVLPVDMERLFKEKGYDIVKSLPAGNTLTLELARAAIAGEQLGQRGATDFLAVSCSSTDYVGHQFGPDAVETEDTYLRLDRDLAAFFAYLDQTVGKGQYTVFLTADHAGTNNLSFQQDHKLPVGGFSPARAGKMLRDSLQARYGRTDLIRGISNYQVVLNYDALRAGKINKERLKRQLIGWLADYPHVAYVVDQTRTADASIPEVVREKIRNGYYPKRSGEIQIIVEPGCFDTNEEGTYKGTSHGTWNPQDSHIPLLFMGWGIEPLGRLFREVHMTDIAPTIATLLRIQMPNGCIGQAIPEVLKQ